MDFRKSISAFPYERAYFVFGGRVGGGDAAFLTETAVCLSDKPAQQQKKHFNRLTMTFFSFFLSLSDKVTMLQSMLS